MHHIAVMNKSWKLIPKIVSGEKKIESRWYQTKRTPWNNINPGDIVFFKDSGEPVSAKAEVLKVLQFELKSKESTKDIIEKYGKEICLVNTNLDTWNPKLKYCILIYLKNAEYLENKFNINRAGFGSGTAWITIDNINKILSSHQI